jgi:hypothetical protein
MVSDLQNLGVEAAIKKNEAIPDKKKKKKKIQL